MTEITNRFSKSKEPKLWNVTQLLLAGETVSWDDLRAVAGGRLSPRTFAFVLRDLEAQGATLIKYRTKEYGTLYRFDPGLAFDPVMRVSKSDGPDALRHPRPPSEAPGAVLSASEDSEVSAYQDHPQKLIEVLLEPLEANESHVDPEEEVSATPEPPSAPAAVEPDDDPSSPGAIDITDDDDLLGVDITTLFGE